MNAALLALLALAADPGAARWMVVPLDGTEAAAAERWIGEAVADEMPRALAGLGVPCIERRLRLRAYAAMGILDTRVSLASAIRVSEALDVGRLVTGRVEVTGEAVTLSARVIDIEQGAIGSPVAVSGPRDALLRLIQALAWDVAKAQGLPTAPEREVFVAARGSPPATAFEAYGRALATSDADHRKRRLASALEAAPGFDEARLELAWLHMNAGEHAVAVRTLAGVGADARAAREARFTAGVGLIRQGRYREAERVYRELAAAQASPGVLSNWGVALLRLGSAPQAVNTLRGALEGEPQNADLAFNLAWALLAQGDYEACAFVARGLAEEVRDVQAQVVLTWALRRAGRADEAEREWQSAVALAPELEPLVEPDLKRGFERVTEQEQLLSLDHAGRSDAELAAIDVGRAERLAAAGDVDGALRELTRAALLNPYDARIHRQLAQVHRTRGQLEAAVNELRLALWCRDEAATHLELARVLTALGRPAEARREAARVLKLEPGNAEARALRR